MDRSRTTEARDLERFRLKAGFDALAIRFQDSNPEEKPSDPADKISRILLGNWSGREDLNLRPLGPEPNGFSNTFEGFCPFCDSGSVRVANGTHTIATFRGPPPATNESPLALKC